MSEIIEPKKPKAKPKSRAAKLSAYEKRYAKDMAKAVKSKNKLNGKGTI